MHLASLAATCHLLCVVGVCPPPSLAASAAVESSYLRGLLPRHASRSSRIMSPPSQLDIQTSGICPSRLHHTGTSKKLTTPRAWGPHSFAQRAWTAPRRVAFGGLAMDAVLRSAQRSAELVSAGSGDVIYSAPLMNSRRFCSLDRKSLSEPARCLFE